MNSVISKRQIDMLQTMIKMKKENDEEKLTLHDQILDHCFMPIKVGIRQHGFTADEIAEELGYADDLRRLMLMKSSICQLATNLCKDGIPFGAIKGDKGKKVYGFCNNREFEELQYSRKVRMISELRAGMKYLNEDDSLLKISDKLVKEYDRQLTFQECSA